METTKTPIAFGKLEVGDKFTYVLFSIANGFVVHQFIKLLGDQAQDTETEIVYGFEDWGICYKESP